MPKFSHKDQPLPMPRGFRGPDTDLTILRIADSSQDPHKIDDASYDGPIDDEEVGEY